MGKTGDWPQAVTELKNAAQALQNIADSLTGLFSGSGGVENVTKQMINSKKKEKPVTLEAVRAVLADKSRSGLTDQVRALIEKYGASKLSEVNPENYEALMADAEALGNE